MQHKPKNESSCYRCFSATQIILLQLNFSPSFWSLQRPIWCELFIFQSSCFVERVATRFIRNAWLSTIGYLIARDLGANTVRALKLSTCKTSMAARYDHAIVIWKGVLKTVRRSTVFMWWNLGFPMIALLIFIGLLRLKKEVNQKENTVEKIAKRRQIRKSTYAQTPISAKFHSIPYCFAAKKIGIFRVRLIAFPIIEFPKLCWTVKHICALPSACW